MGQPLKGKFNILQEVALAAHETEYTGNVSCRNILRTMELTELAARRLIAQGLAKSAARPVLAQPDAVARWMLALQGQKFDAGIRAMAMRCGKAESTVRKSLAQGLIVRNWPQRGTLHFLAAEDVHWLSTIKPASSTSGTVKRRIAAGLDADLTEVATAIGGLLAFGPRTRAECYAVIEQIGWKTVDYPPASLMRCLGEQGWLVQGDKKGKEETFQLVSQLPVPQREFSSSEEKLLQLGSRFASARGPVTVADLSWWAGIGKRMAARALRLAVHAQALIEFRSDDLTYFMGTWQADVTKAERTAALRRRLTLPAFDEYIMGYSDRANILPPAVAPEVLSLNGISWDFHVRGGIITGRA